MKCDLNFKLKQSLDTLDLSEILAGSAFLFFCVLDILIMYIFVTSSVCTIVIIIMLYSSLSQVTSEIFIPENKLRNSLQNVTSGSDDKAAAKPGVPEPQCWNFVH